jgi:hypothetical protein
MSLWPKGRLAHAVRIATKQVIVNFVGEMMEIEASCDENVNDDSLSLTHKWGNLDGNVKITTKELQSTPKFAINKISNQDFNLRLGAINYNKDNISKFRNICKNVKQRPTYFRLISKDFFTMEKV